MGLEDTLAMRYPVVVHDDESAGYGVTVPDLPGCFSGGDTLDAALEMAREAISGHVETLLMDGQRVPEPQHLETHRANPDFAGGIWALVDVDLSKLTGESLRVNVTMPARVLAIVDAAAAREGESRSGLLARAALEHVERQATA